MLQSGEQLKHWSFKSFGVHKKRYEFWKTHHLYTGNFNRNFMQDGAPYNTKIKDMNLNYVSPQKQKVLFFPPKKNELKNTSWV